MAASLADASKKKKIARALVSYYSQIHELSSETLEKIEKLGDA